MYDFQWKNLGFSWLPWLPWQPKSWLPWRILQDYKATPLVYMGTIFTSGSLVEKLVKINELMMMSTLIYDSHWNHANLHYQLERHDDV